MCHYGGVSSEKPVQYFPPQEPGNPADAHEQYVHPAIPDPPKRTALTPLIALSAALVVVGAAVAAWWFGWSGDGGDVGKRAGDLDVHVDGAGGAAGAAGPPDGRAGACPGDPRQ